MVSSKRGRPPKYAREEALNNAMRAFWRNSYEGTSLDDLCQATGMNRPSLYNAFGDKERLFCSAVDWYLSHEGNLTQYWLQSDASVAEAFGNLLYGYIKLFSQPDTGRGCLVVLGAINCRPEHQHLADKLIDQRRNTRTQVTSFLQRAALRGELRADANPEALAEFFMSVFNGLSVQARDGSTPAQMQHIVEQALRLFATWADNNKSENHD
ncbi:TetR/AcrR family transcriptional regulator [Pantoea dispersa]|uniref:TetR/AcrR family transcriptional regulator n=1 Tax=Pantoea dispersa TaxID=59814 RepID=UPI0039B37066